MTLPSNIFISYSHDSPAHAAAVLALANRLRQDGLNCQIDQYINGFPAEGWQRWMEDCIEQADFVLIICTSFYLQRFRGRGAEGGRGVNFEGLVISQVLYDNYYRNSRFIPVLLENGTLDDVPLPLKSYSSYQLPADYTQLYRLLTNQHATPAPDIGETVALPTQQPTFSPSQAKPSKRENGNMSYAMKAAWITAIATLFAAVIAGLFALFSQPSISTQGDCAGVITGDVNQNVVMDCSKGDEQ